MSRVAQAQVALMLLTRLPAGRVGADAPALGHTIWAWPLVGGLIGAIAALAVWILNALSVPPLVAGLIAVSILALVTGGLHEDGLADVADGFGGGATLARKLEIMRDSRVGSYGVLALILVTGIKLGAMLDLSVGALMTAFVALNVASRALMAVPLILLPAARDDGMGARVVASQGQAGLGLALAAVVLGVAFGGSAVGVTGVMAATALAMTALAKRQINGQTGDVCGATQALTETAGWITIAALYATS